GGSGGGGDMVPPTVSITSPVDGAMVPSGFEVHVTALDNVGVASVDLLVDGSRVDQKTASPFDFQIAAGLLSPGAHALVARGGSHALVARASDAAGNTAMSPSVMVTVEANGSGGAGGSGGHGGGSGGAGGSGGGNTGSGNMVGGGCSSAPGAIAPSGLVFLIA